MRNYGAFMKELSDPWLVWEIIETLYPFKCYIWFRFWSCFSRASLLLFVVWRVPRILDFTVLSIGFPYFTNVVQLLCSLSGWLHLNCSSIGTGFNGAETNCRIAHNLGILLMNSNCFAIYFQQHSSYVCSDIYYAPWAVISIDITTGCLK